MRRALIIGIDDYPNRPLFGCINDAVSIHNLLARNEDGSPNFDCRLLTDNVTCSRLRHELDRFFGTQADAVLLYFAGHGGYSGNTGAGHLLARDSSGQDDGIPTLEIIERATRGTFHDATVILDCCFSGTLGKSALFANAALLPAGMSVLTACRHDEGAVESDGSGLFTSLVCDALAGSAADVRGHVTLPSVYSLVDQILSAWEQRPQFLANVSRFCVLRRCRGLLSDDDLRVLPTLFPGPDYEHPLDPSYEPEAGAEHEHPEHENIFAIMQRLRDGGLLKPVGATHLYHAAMDSQRCALTPLGRYYWALARAQRV
ncbi:MAG: caspase family protein [Proteobacteria bacterium]|nr:caspase family protein [Pseudomonadota bacterium]